MNPTSLGVIGPGFFKLVPLHHEVGCSAPTTSDTIGIYYAGDLAAI